MCCYYSNQRAQQAMRNWLAFVAAELIKLSSNTHPDLKEGRKKEDSKSNFKMNKKEAFLRTSN